MHQSPQPWVPAGSRARITEIAEDRLGAGTTMAETVAGIESLIAASDRLHDEEAFNLNPASNVLNPRAAALLASGAGPRTSLGYAGAKYEMGLEHIEQVEVVTAELAARVFNASFAEVRVPSGAMAQPLRVHGHEPSRSDHHRLARDDRRAHHSPRRRCGPVSTVSPPSRPPSTAEPTAATSMRWAAPRPRSPTQPDHHGRFAQPVRTPRGEGPRDRR
jgi:hypothetical protein